ncbi:reverse transcriptase domain-containing protein [Tanacetum coccineum]
MARSIRRIRLDNLECALRSQSINDIFPNLLYLLYLRIVIFMDTAYVDKRDTPYWELVKTPSGDGVAIIKRWRQDLHRDGVRDPATMSGRGQLKEDLESSTWRRCQDFKAMSSCHLHFDISFADALLLMPRFALKIKSLLMNKEKLLELAKIPLNENCSAMLVKKLPEKLGDPDKFLIQCNFPGMDLSLPELTPTRMTLELADRSITYPKGLAEDVFVKVGKFHFPTDFVVVDFEADPRVPLILGRSFLRTGRALIDVYGEEITLRVDNEAVTFNIDQTTRYSSTNDKLVNRIDIIDTVCEEYALELLGFPPRHLSHLLLNSFWKKSKLILRTIRFHWKLITPIEIRRKIFV